MSKENSKTIEVYEKTARLYLSNSDEHDRLNPARAKQKSEKLQELIRTSFSSLPKSAKIFEIGSGNGINAKFIESLGFDVTASDTASAFIKATQNTGVKTIRFDALKDNFPEKYYGIFCWRVFVHFTKDDALTIMQKVYDALEDNGIFIFNAINRETRPVDDEWVDFDNEYKMGEERFYSYFKQSDLDDMISQTKFKIKDFHKEGGDNNNKWLVYVLEKQPYKFIVEPIFMKVIQTFFVYSSQ